MTHPHKPPYNPSAGTGGLSEREELLNNEKIRWKHTPSIWAPLVAGWLLRRGPDWLEADAQVSLHPLQGLARRHGRRSGPQPLQPTPRFCPHMFPFFPRAATLGHSGHPGWAP